MALQKFILLSFAAITFMSVSAGAFPGDRRPGRGPGHGPGGGGPAPIPSFPGNPAPGPGYPAPGNPGPGYGRQESRNIFIGQRVGNTDLPLRQLGRIGDDYRGYSVESVVVELRGYDQSTQISLVTDGRQGDTIYNPQGRILLRPRFGDVIGRDFTNLILSVRGVVDIGNITVNLVDRGGGYNPNPGPGPGYPEMINISINRRMMGISRLELAPYIDMYRYRGYRIESVDVEAQAAFNNALLDLLINGYNQGQTMSVDRFRRLVSFRPYNATIGYGGDSIAINTRGDVDIFRVTIRLVR
ncbi:hypothetical protein AZI86_05550 [Bdellovibrio bacteriovorus]|uniref:Uncharacterized protein n=1 Tax=Bdellovibrio bacteriovorus TaxID=959 RepID=A0A150WPT0_BDEBC|nr:hypothetical protein [Bdellovibrio bacteriovorus]KYG66511.1 hypothetical protein AZI86_05550 [Bdellovibrio bacteriovorus]